MKARIPIPKCYKEQVDEYCKDFCNKELKKQQLTLVTRTMKIASVMLHQNYGFGKDRLTKLWRAIIDFTDIMDDDPVRWYHIDRELIDEIGLDVSREDYEVMDD